ncbi:sarcosine oxidase subunit delta [Alphaproteobacteria bacterium]|nr:sarcosine oxidase subunit delta [Alphaproteobacteria bacterium]
MIINHPLLGPRDASEFIYLGDALLLNRPNWDEEKSEDNFYKYLYLRENVAGMHKELWFHQQGDRSWLVISRNTVTHEIFKVELATEFKKNMGKSND